MERKLTFEEQQDLNRTRDTAMRVACEGLTTLELQRLNPSLLKAAPDMCEALGKIKAWAVKKNELIGENNQIIIAKCFLVLAKADEKCKEH